MDGNSVSWAWVEAKLGGLLVIGAESIYILAALAPSWVRAGW
jgi:hypothetical protein